MHTHPNAGLTSLGRERLLRRHIDHGESLASLAAEDGISDRSAYKLLACYRSDCAAALVDLHHESCTLRRIARMPAVPFSIVGRVVIALGLGWLKNMQPPERVRRYQ